MHTRSYGFLKTAKDLLPFVLTAVFFCLCVFAIGHFESYTLVENNDSVMPQENQLPAAAPAQMTDTSDVPYITDTRTVTEHDGGLGIFDCFGELVEKFELDISSLPHEDRKLLAEGIVFDSEAEMRDFLESLDS